MVPGSFFHLVAKCFFGMDWRGFAFVLIQANTLANGKQMKARWNGVARKGNCTLTQNSPSNFLVQDFQICIEAFWGAVSSEKLFYTEKEESVLIGRQSLSQELLPVLRYTVALWRPGAN